MAGHFLRFALVFTAAFAVAFGALVWWVGSAGFDWALARELLREQWRHEALDRRDELARRCNEAKSAVVAELAAGRLTLAEAAIQFKQIQETMADDGVDAVLGPWQKPDGDQGVYLCVLSWCAAYLREDPTRSSVVLPRLEQEYRQRFHTAPWAEEGPE